MIIRFTPRGSRLLASVIELVEEIEGEFAEGLPDGDFDLLRQGLQAIADRIDPEGAFGVGDEAVRKPYSDPTLL